LGFIDQVKPLAAPALATRPRRSGRYGALEILAVAAPDWLAATLDVPDWTARYGVRVDSWRLPAVQSKRDALAAAYGQDGFTLLEAVYGADAPHWLAEIPAVEVLRQVLLQNYVIVTDRRGREVITRREADVHGLPPGRSRLTSPYDSDARCGGKRGLAARAARFGPP
jgi:hypothetical protein